MSEAERHTREIEQNCFSSLKQKTDHVQIPSFGMQQVIDEHPFEWLDLIQIPNFRKAFDVFSLFSNLGL